MGGIVFGCIVPHPPIIIPEIGKGRLKEANATYDSMRLLAREMSDYAIDTVVIISPHGVNYYDSMGVATAPTSDGSFDSWGVKGLDYRSPNDSEFVNALMEEAK